MLTVADKSTQKNGKYIVNTGFVLEFKKKVWGRYAVPYVKDTPGSKMPPL